MTLNKTVTNDNGGTLGVSDFPLFISGNPTTSGVAATLSAGDYVASETTQPGYAAGDWTGDCNAAGNVSLSVGENKTCTINNDDIAPVLIIDKTPDNGEILLDGVNSALATFTMVVTNIGGGPAINVDIDDVLPSPDSGLADLVWSVVSTEGVTGTCSVEGDGITLHCDIAFMALDPTPGNDPPDGDEASFTVVVQATIPADYFAPAGTPGGPGDLGSNFEIEGNLVVDAPPAVDWDCAATNLSCSLPNFVNKPDELSGQGDNSFGKGAKENTPVPTVVAGSIPPNKSDLLNFLFNEEEVEGNVFIELGWLRSNTLGTSNFDFELNQSNVLSSNGVTEVRTIGDILITFDFAAGGNVVNLGLREWNGSAWVNPLDGTNSAIDLDASAFAVGAVNDPDSFGTPPDGVLNPFTGELLLDNTFGEAVVNITQAFEGLGCRSFASAFVKSRSSDSFTSALKDFIAPIDVDINTCRTIGLDNEAFTDADNFDPAVSDTGSISVSNDTGPGI